MLLIILVIQNDCQTLSGPLPQSGSPAREARGAAAAATSGNKMINSPVFLDFNGPNLTKLRVQLQTLCWSPYDGRGDITKCCAQGAR